MTWTWRDPDITWRAATGGDASPRDLVEAYLDDRGTLPPDDVIDAITDYYTAALTDHAGGQLSVTRAGVVYADVGPAGHDTRPDVHVRVAYALDRPEVVRRLREAFGAVQLRDVVDAYRRDHTDHEPHQGDLPRTIT